MAAARACAKGQGGVTDDELQEWPPSLRLIASAIGAERALQLANAVGGVSVHVPHTYSARHLWAPYISEEEWSRVASLLGGQSFMLPRGVYLRSTKRLVCELVDAGESTRTIALRLHISQRQVQRILTDLDMRCRAPIDPRQQNLFGDE